MVGRNADWCSHCGKQFGGFSKKLKMELLYGPAIALLDISLKKPKTALAGVAQWIECELQTQGSQV